MVDVNSEDPLFNPFPLFGMIRSIPNGFPDTLKGLHTMDLEKNGEDDELNLTSDGWRCMIMSVNDQVNSPPPGPQ